MADETRHRFGLRVDLEGAELAAAQMHDLDDELRRILHSSGQAADGADDEARKIKKLTATRADYLAVLRSVSPTLSLFVDGLYRASKIAGDLATRQINLRGTVESLTTALRNNFNTLKLFGAIGFVLFAFNQLIGAFRAMREEQERVADAMRKEKDALTELDRVRAGHAATLEREAFARREGGYTAEEARRAAGQLEQIQRMAPYLDPQAARQAVVLSGAQRSNEELIRIGLLVQSDRLKESGAMAPEAREVRREAALRRYAEIVTPELRKEAEQRGDLAGLAAETIKGRRTSEYGIRELLEGLGYKDAGLDLDQLAVVVANLKEAQQGKARGMGAAYEALKAIWTGADAAELERLATTRSLAQMGITAGPEVVQAAMAAFTQIERLAQKLGEAAEKMKRAAERMEGQPTTVNQFHHARVTYPDARGQERARRNGETMLRSRE